jgi:hypothetical protein
MYYGAKIQIVLVVIGAGVLLIWKVSMNIIFMLMNTIFSDFHPFERATQGFCDTFVMK